ncbi:MAG: arginine--tRNA ligase [Lachnospiraceae bacterium]|nr:arginine--tRNA ligase [Lachnospiraceae bacterium]
MERLPEILLTDVEKDSLSHPEQIRCTAVTPEKSGEKETIIIDYGGANVAKPLHVGHLRAAVIGESIKRIKRFAGDEVIGDVHLGDWGLQMGLIITELHERKPELCYFDEAYDGDYPTEPPFTIAELEEIYPTASGKSKEDEAYKNAAMQATKELQQGRRGYQAILKHIMDVSVTDLKKNYDALGVSFDLWKGESDADPYIPDMVEKMKADGFAYESEGALVVDVSEPTDTKEIPPCMILKSDGAALYDTTDLATLIWREQDYHPDEVIYVVDKRQELHFIQCFRCAKKTGITPLDTKLIFIGFGTMNGKDGKPFKTRDGGVMRLEHLISDIGDKMYDKIMENGTMDEAEAREVSRKVGLSALKYGDLSNQASKDYVFDVERFTSFEGNTGPYILYTMVRIKSILKKYEEAGGSLSADMGSSILPPADESQHTLFNILMRFNAAMRGAYEENAPHRICAYIYELSNAFNHFYHETRILAETDEKRKLSYISTLRLTLMILEQCIDLLGFEAPERM